MELFSERNGLKSKILHPEEMPIGLKNRIWNASKDNIDNISGSLDKNSLIRKLWSDFFKNSTTYLRGTTSLKTGITHYNIGYIEAEFNKLQWHGVYSFIEFLAENLNSTRKPHYIGVVNEIFKEEGAQYEMIDGKVVKLMTTEEADLITKVQSEKTSASDHITKAVALFNKRPDPDYPNSIKESISAVEAIVRDITGNQSAVLSEGVKKLGLHSALEQGITKLYAWTSDEGGIRHSSKDAETPPSEAEARYMLVQCSLLVNYLADRARVTEV